LPDSVSIYLTDSSYDLSRTS